MKSKNEICAMKMTREINEKDKTIAKNHTE